MTPRQRTGDIPDTRAGAWWEAARGGEPHRAWAALADAHPTAGPVFGRSGHALVCGEQTGSPPAEVVGELVVAGHRWRMLSLPDLQQSRPPPEWLHGVGEMRLGLSLWLREQAVRRLRKRTAGQTPLIHLQLVRATLAEAAAEQVMAEGLLGDPQDGPSPALRAVGRHLTAADRSVLRLFGASGYLSDGPGQVAYLSELLADAYLESEAGDHAKECDDRAG